MDLHGTAAVVTGGSSGLGAATVALLAERGARVVVIDRPGTCSDEAPPGVDHLTADVTDEAQVDAAFDQVAQLGEPLRVVVSCAAIGHAQRILGRNGSHDAGAFHGVVAANLTGTFHVLNAAARVMGATDADADGRRGVIVNTASTAAYDGQIGQVAYAASKGGVVSMTLPAARELAGLGIRVCAIAPGIMASTKFSRLDPTLIDRLAEQVPFPHRPGRPREFADAVAAVIDLDYLNGTVLRLDGGLRMAPR